MNNISIAFFETIHIVINIYILIIIVSALISWIRPNPYNPIVRILYSLTEPVYNAIRKIIPTTFGMIDIAPMIVLFILIFLDNLITRYIYAF
ncbi:MAG: YggT family protein [Campylobacteraceae bacterium]|jgi:YggT family protein|nr:YggT family protein [Campylobacteraceae bacterium]